MLVVRDRASGVRRCICLALILVPVVGASGALAMNKCFADGRVTYQDAPCDKDRPIPLREKASRPDYETLHRRLDELAALGVGLLKRKPKPEPSTDENTNKPNCRYVEPRYSISDLEREHLKERYGECLREQTERNNAVSSARLTQRVDDANKGCGEKLEQWPQVGMTDEKFRHCTIHGLMGGAFQIVAREENGVPLRLYVFPTRQAARVYSIGGVVTAVRP